MRTPSRLRLELLALVIVWGCAGTETGNPATRNACGGVVCEPCAPPITLHVTHPERSPATLDLSADGEACAAESTRTTCQLEGAPYTTPGVHRIVLSASGLSPQTVEVEVKANTQLCCNCGYVPTQLDVTLGSSL